jgi:hypothetical protein
MDSMCCSEQHRASPAGKHILHRSPQKLGIAAEQGPHEITNHMMFVKRDAVRGPPQHRRNPPHQTHEFWNKVCNAVRQSFGHPVEHLDEQQAPYTQPAWSFRLPIPNAAEC